MPSISRRDFLNGVALTVASGLTPAEQAAADPARYPPGLTGLRGQHPGSLAVAHEGHPDLLHRLSVIFAADLGAQTEDVLIALHDFAPSLGRIEVLSRRSAEMAPHETA